MDEKVRPMQSTPPLVLFLHIGLIFKNLEKRE